VRQRCTGWEFAAYKTTSSFAAASSRGGSDVEVDYLFTDGSLSNLIAVAHGKAYIMDSPESDDLATVEDFFTRHKDELLGEMESAYGTSGITVRTQLYEVREMSCGIPALHLDLLATAQGITLEQYFLFFFKDEIMYLALVNVVNGMPAREHIDFLTANITFE
jgi:hypothetical protein